MAIFSGSFFGYREYTKKAALISRPVVFPVIDPEIRLQWWHWDLLGPIPYAYNVFKGLANDDFPDKFILFPFFTRMILANIRDNPAKLQFCYDQDEEVYFDEREFDSGFIRVEAAWGFRIKNAVPGNPARYQIVPCR